MSLSSVRELVCGVGLDCGEDGGLGMCPTGLGRGSLSGWSICRGGGVAQAWFNLDGCLSPVRLGSTVGTVTKFGALECLSVLLTDSRAFFFICRGSRTPMVGVALNSLL